MNQPNLNPEMIWQNRNLRRKLGYEDPMWFDLLYLRHHFDYPLAPFHLEMMHLIRKPEYSLAAVMAFRESGKSAILNTGNVLWHILGRPQKRFVVIVSKSQEQAKSHFANIRSELEQNERLIEDFGPFNDKRADFAKMSLDLVYHDAKILAVQRGDALRGLKHGKYRPDLIILDDVEDILSSNDRREQRDIMTWFESEVIPLGTAGTRIFILGNLLNEKSFMMRLREKILKKEIDGIFRVYPFSDDNGKILWPGKFSDKAKIETIKARCDPQIWRREYELLLGEAGSRRLKETDPATIESLRLCQEETAEIQKRYEPKLATKPSVQESLVTAMKIYQIAAPEYSHIPNYQPGHPLRPIREAYRREISQAFGRHMQRLTELANPLPKAEEKKN